MTRTITGADAAALTEILDQLIADDANTMGFIDTTSGGGATPAQAAELRATWAGILGRLTAAQAEPQAPEAAVAAQIRAYGGDPAEFGYASAEAWAADMLGRFPAVRASGAALAEAVADAVAAF